MKRCKPKCNLLCVLILLGCFAQNAAAIETDVFANSKCYIELQLPSGGTESIWMTGSSIMEVLFAGVEGQTGDHDGDGRDDVNSVLTVFSFAGTSPTLGPLHMDLSATIQSAGVMEEMANNTPGILDVPPFTATGSVDSFFDVFIELDIAGQVIHNGMAKRLSDIITHKPPTAADIYQNFSSTPLFDIYGYPTGFTLKTTRYIPNPVTELDIFDYSKCQLVINTPDYGFQTIQMTGNSTMRVFFEGLSEGMAQDDDGDGREEVQTELTEWTFAGNNPVLGDVLLLVNNDYAPSLGEMEELANNTPGTLDVAPFTATGSVDSFFDVFLKVQIGGQVYHNVSPLYISEIITHKPPQAGYIWDNATDVPLYDSDNNPTRYSVYAIAYEPAAPPPACGDGEHPYPIGDLNLDCRVNFEDIAIIALHWLECTSPECD